MDAARRIVVVGNGMAGARLVGAVRARRPDAAITVLGGEPHAAYNRILLSAVLAGERTLDDIALGGTDGATLHLGDPVCRIDRAARTVATVGGRRIDYDALVLATGSQPIALPIAGAQLPGVLSFRDIADVERMVTAARPGARAVVIGGGLLGLEAAEGLRRRGMAVTVVHLMDWLMERQLDPAGGALLRHLLERRGLDIVLPAETAAIVGDDRVEGVRLADGRVLPAELVVMAVGIRPNIALAQAAGLACGRGIQVDDALQTSDPAIYAIGECIEHRARCYGLVEPIWQQVELCARRLAGERAARYEGSVDATSLKVSGIGVYSAGALDAGDIGEAIVLRDLERGVYRKLVLRDGKLVGVVLLGDTTDGPWYGALIRDGVSIAPMRRDLAFGRCFTEALAA
jgi:nitrite reductase (NADH) large subunit